MRPSKFIAALSFASSSHAFTHKAPPFLNFSSPAPYIFSSLNGLRQQWSNTFFPNGHTITAASIPKHTLFYHGRLDAQPPPSPEWLAFDIEMSYAIMGNTAKSRILTYRTTREVKALYFDGTSANLIGAGTESQMTFLYGDSESVPARPGPGPGRPGEGRGPRRPPPGEGRGDGPPDGPHDGPHDGPPGEPFGELHGGPHHGAHHGPYGRPHHGPPDKHHGQRPLESTPDDEPPRWNPLGDEYFRARGLCGWIKDKGLGGSGWGYEGIIRMNAGFEMIWCDFNSTSLALISNLDVSVPLLKNQPSSVGKSHGLSLLEQRSRKWDALGSYGEDVHSRDEGPHGPGMTDRGEPFRSVASYMWFAAAAKRYGNLGIGGGETRARIETCGFFSFYDEAMEGQGVARVAEERTAFNITVEGRWVGRREGDEKIKALEELMRRRRQHRANHVTKEDGIVMLTRGEESLRTALNKTACSGIAWDDITHEITAYYAKNLLVLQDTLSSGLHDANPSYDSIRTWLEQVRSLTHWFMLPFFEYPAGPYTKKLLREDFSLDSPGVQEAITRCVGQYSTETSESLSPSETLLATAISQTLSSICTSTFSIGLSVERLWLAHFNTNTETLAEDGVTHSTRKLAKRWTEELEELMAWLGWVDQWTACEGPCGAGEVCYIPMWPVGGWIWGEDADEALWRPQCVNMTAYLPRT